MTVEDLRSGLKLVGPVISNPSMFELSFKCNNFIDIVELISLVFCWLAPDSIICLKLSNILILVGSLICNSVHLIFI